VAEPHDGIDTIGVTVLEGRIRLFYAPAFVLSCSRRRLVQ
jgi:hypothetical protein